MFFWTRAILCIGTVTVLAVQRLPPAERTAADLKPPSAAAVIGTACRARPDLCAAAVTRSLGPSPAGLSLERVRGSLDANPALRHRLQGHDLPVALLARSLT